MTTTIIGSVASIKSRKSRSGSLIDDAISWIVVIVDVVLLFFHFWGGGKTLIELSADWAHKAC